MIRKCTAEPEPSALHATDQCVLQRETDRDEGLPLRKARPHVGAMGSLQ